MPNLIKLLSFLFIVFLTGCSSSFLGTNKNEWDTALNHIEDANGLDHSGSLYERQNRINRLELDTRNISVNKRGYEVIFYNESPLPAQFEVRYPGFFSGLSLPIRRHSIGGDTILTDTLMSGVYEVQISSTYKDTTKVLKVYAAPSWECHAKKHVYGSTGLVTLYKFRKNRYR
ncbi:MAG: hypothetical protein WC415_04505 [Patescibacteria group bacterium]|jgi:hypothetical protein